MMASNDMDLAKIEQGVRLILEGVGEDPNREGLLETPSRVARMYEECFAGLHQDPAVHFETLFDEHHDEMVIVHDIPFFSMCEHHLVPFFGKAHIAYLPSESGKICGISKLARLVEVYARRPQVQEPYLAGCRYFGRTAEPPRRCRGYGSGASVHEHARR